MEGRRLKHKSLHSQQYTVFIITDEHTGCTQAVTLSSQTHTQIEKDTDTPLVAPGVGLHIWILLSSKEEESVWL